jgi:hypothetical protein
MCDRGLWRDDRLYGTPRWYLERPRDWWMFFPEELQKPVVFIGEYAWDDPRLAGTAFFASVEIEGLKWIYLVTASHCVWDWEQDKPRTDLFMRINVGGSEGVMDARLPDGSKWFMHPDPYPKVDIAVRPMDGALADALADLGYRWIPESMFFDERHLSDNPNYGVGLAEEVVAVGLFTNHAGKMHNEPITRMGNIAMIPPDPVQTNETLGPMEVYLIELRSIAGMSGSPVFVPHRTLIGEEQRPISLFGVLLGHYPAEIADMEGVAVNMGIGMVAPASKLREILFSPEVSATRAKRPKDEEEKRTDAVMDSARPAGTGFTKEQFEDALRKVTRKVTPPEERSERGKH